jgi:Galactose oxidase-like, Early set domain
MRLKELAATVLLSWLVLQPVCRGDDASAVEDKGQPQATERSLMEDGAWSPIVSLKDLTDTFKGTHDIPRPDTGWWVTPIHVNLLADGRVLVTGWSRPSTQSCEDHQGRLNGTTFVLDPRNLETEWPKTLAITPLDEKPEKPGDVLYCAGHAPLADGRLLFMGGARYKNLGDVEYPPPFNQKEYGLPYARIFDPQTSQFTLVPHHNPGDPEPADASGWPSESGGGLPYEPGMMWYPTNTRLPGGKILTNGGYARWVAVMDARKWKYLNKSVVLFDPTAYDMGWNPWTVWVSHAKAPREVGIDVFDYPKAFVLSEPVVIEGLPRHVAIFGGLGWDPEDLDYMPRITFLSLDERVPEERRFATPPNAKRPQGGMLHETTAVLLATGEILIMGGGKDADQDGQRIDVYVPSKDQWRTSLDTGITRQKAASTLLPDGSVLIVNGEDSYQTERNKGDRTRPTIYDPQTATFKDLSSWTDDPEMRGYHNVALLLKDGRVLVGGGRVYSGGFEGRYRIGCERPELRIFSPPYLFKGPRPRLKAVAEPMQIKTGGAPFRVTFDGPELRKTSGVVLIALGAFTHGFDQNQRYISLRFEKAEGDTIVVTPPESAQIAPEGYYNLFLISEAGVPSAGLSVRVQ